jgi:hypothetical protein
MHATIRTYSDPELADLLTSRKDEVEELIGAVPGIHSYTLLRTPEGVAAVAVGDDEAATEASRAAAADFLRREAPNSPPPVITGGTVIVQLGAGVRA